MIAKKFNIDLLTERLYNYLDYTNLSRSDKQIVDFIYMKFYQCLEHTYDSKKYMGKENLFDVYDYESMETSKFRSDLGNWLIDNELGLIFSNLYGAHTATRAVLMVFHAFKNGDVNESNLNSLYTYDELVLSDLYTGLHHGLYLSGMNDEKIEDCQIVIGSRYFILNKGINQNRLTYDFKMNVSPYEKKDALKDYKDIINKTKDIN